MGSDPASETRGKVVHRREIDYTNLWPIALAPVIPAVGIALRCADQRAPRRNAPDITAVFERPARVLTRAPSFRRPYPQYRWPVIGTIGGAILLGAHNMVIGTGVSTK